MIKPISDAKEEAVDDDLPEIFKINVVNAEFDQSEVEISHIDNDNIKMELRELIGNYTTLKT